MASTATDMQSGSLEQRREGVELLTKEQQFNTSILRLRVNSDDVLVHLGRVINDNFFDEIYSEFSISRVKARRSINANPEKRGELNELLITNYNYEQALQPA